VTVNSVAARWTLTAQSPTAEQRGTIVVLAALRLKKTAGSRIGRLIGAGDADEAEQLERHEVETTTGADGVLRAAGVSEFHFLLPRRKYNLTVTVESYDTPLISREAETKKVGQGMPAELATALPDEVWRVYVGSEHRLGEWLASSPKDMVWTFQPDFSMMQSLWLNACFTLPSPDSPITECPNPISRYCLDLTNASPWLRCKKVRRHKHDFTLTINHNYRETFERCGALHKERGSGTWITPQLVAALDSCRQQGGRLKVYSIELWEKSSGDLAAAIMALSVGDIFHDYTMATVKRDKRSPGAILTKVVGHLLTECGYKLWYWGFKNPYMAEYDENYGGLSMDSRRDFWPRWKAALSCASPCDLADRVRLGPEGTLDLATL